MKSLSPGEMNRMSKIFRKHTFKSRSALFSSLTNLPVWNSRTLLSQSTFDDATSPRVFHCPLFMNHQRRCYVNPYLKDYVCDIEDTTVGDGSFEIYFLGTSAGAPSRERMCSATMLRINGQSLLFDAAEGVQRQLMRSTVPLGSIANIFITHLHGDHIFGLPGLLLGLMIASKSQEESKPAGGLTINLYGPPGLYNYVAMSLSLSMSKISSGEIVVTEMIGGHADPGPQQQNRKWSRKNPLHENYLEMSRKNLFRKTLEQNDDSTWTIEMPRTKFYNQREDRDLFVSAAEVKHVNNVMTFGYVVREEEPRPNIDPKKAMNLGVKRGKKYAALKKGFPVDSDCGSYLVYPEEVLVKTSAKRARKFAIMGDNFQISLPLYQLCQDCDVLVHEATAMGIDDDLAASRGHSTPKIAGRVAKNMNAKVLVLNHLGGVAQRCDVELLSVTAETNEGRSHILVAHDLMKLSVPRKGFDNPMECEEEIPMECEEEMSVEWEEETEKTNGITHYDSRE